MLNWCIYISYSCILYAVNRKYHLIKSSVIYVHLIGLNDLLQLICKFQDCVHDKKLERAGVYPLVICWPHWELKHLLECQIDMILMIFFSFVDISTIEFISLCWDMGICYWIESLNYKLIVCAYKVK